MYGAERLYGAAATQGGVSVDTPRWGGNATSLRGGRQGVTPPESHIVAILVLLNIFCSIFGPYILDALLFRIVCHQSVIEKMYFL